MTNSEEKPAPSGTPEWQRGQADVVTTPAATEDNTVDVARRFLDDDAIKTAPRDKKAAFLKAKGVEDGEVQKLLEETEERSKPIETEAAQPPPPPQSQPPPGPQSADADRPPIVTYPEFLTKPTRPPPLVTSNGILSTLYAFAGISTALYGTSKYILAPMAESLTEARLDFHESASRNLDSILGQLEKSVSEIPPSYSKHDAGSEDASDVDDPSEMFHRDVGTQTSFLSNTATTLAKEPSQSESLRQADRLSALIKSLSGLKDEFRTQSEDLEDIKTLVDVFRDDLDALTYSGQSDFVGGFDMHKSRKAEPEDELRKVRDNIRKVKGVLLSTRSFPASTR